MLYKYDRPISLGQVSVKEGSVRRIGGPSKRQEGSAGLWISAKLDEPEPQKMHFQIKIC